MLYLLEVLFEEFFDEFYKITDEIQRYFIKNLLLNLDMKLSTENIAVYYCVNNYQDDVNDLLDFIQSL